MNRREPCGPQPPLWTKLVRLDEVPADAKMATPSKPRLSSWTQTALLYLAGVRILLNKLLFSWRTPAPIIWHSARVLCLGLEGAGKSSLIRRAADSTAALVDAIGPTTGFKVRTVVIPPDWKLEVWDVGGVARPFWSRYVTYDTAALLWVVDAADGARLAESGAQLAAILQSEPRLRRMPLMVLGCKAELPTALDAVAVASGLGLAEMQERRLICGQQHIQMVSAVDGRNLLQALQWVSQKIEAMAGGDVVEVRRA